MKIKIELEYDVDGEQPDHQDVIDAIHERLCIGVITSEEVGKPDMWTLIPAGNIIEVLPNVAHEPRPTDRRTNDER